MTIHQNSGSRVVVVWLGVGDVIVGPLMSPDGDRQDGVVLFPTNRGMGPGQFVDFNDPSTIPSDLQELSSLEKPRIEIYLPSLEACRGALVLIDALRKAVDVVGTRINEERKTGVSHEFKAEE